MAPTREEGCSLNVSDRNARKVLATNPRPPSKSSDLSSAYVVPLSPEKGRTEIHLRVLCIL
jgi:hypothetical protein